MDALALRGLLGAFALISAGFVLSACNTTKATADTFAKFTSSTSPSEWISVDGVIQKDKQARLFAAVAFENLEQNIARGNGEYLTSLGVLLDIPAGEEKEFASSAQRNYPLLFAPERRTAESLLSMLMSKEARPSSSPLPTSSSLTLLRKGTKYETAYHNSSGDLSGPLVGVCGDHSCGFEQTGER